MKRSFDIVVASIGLLLVAPVCAVVAVSIAVSSPGPVLFRQQRVGLGGRTFEILKFRTMTHTPELPEVLLTAAGDRRVARIGGLLRASKLDELPQLWNVIRGDMSLVGPRPEVAKYVALYPPEVAAKVLSVRPGITDEASIVFRNESEILGSADDPERAYIETVLPRKLVLYQRYVDRHSLRGDLGIIARTLWSVLRNSRSNKKSEQFDSSAG